MPPRYTLCVGYASLCCLSAGCNLAIGGLYELGLELVLHSGRRLNLGAKWLGNYQKPHHILSCERIFLLDSLSIL
jgi:hypothetical protein